MQALTQDYSLEQHFAAAKARACSKPKDMRRRNSRSSEGHSIATPSPRPSTSSAPISVPDVSTISSRLVPARHGAWHPQCAVVHQFMVAITNFSVRLSSTFESRTTRKLLIRLTLSASQTRFDQQVTKNCAYAGLLQLVHDTHAAPAGKDRRWMTGRSMLWRPSISNTLREAWMRLTPGAMSSSSITAAESCKGQSICLWQHVHPVSATSE